MKAILCAGFAAEPQLQLGETTAPTPGRNDVEVAVHDLGRHLGARVIAGVGSRDKAAVVRDRGAEHVIVYTEEDLRERIRSLTGDRGVDVCLDHVGGDVFAAMARSMNCGGRLVGTGELRPHVGGTMSWEDAAVALDLLRRREAQGRVVLQVLQPAQPLA